MGDPARPARKGHCRWPRNGMARSVAWSGLVGSPMRMGSYIDGAFANVVP